MPFVNVKLVEGVFSTVEKHAMVKALSDVMVRFWEADNPRRMGRRGAGSEFLT